MVALGLSQRTTRMASIAPASAFFVKRAKNNLYFTRFGSNPKFYGAGRSLVSLSLTISQCRPQPLPFSTRTLGEQVVAVATLQPPSYLRQSVSRCSTPPLDQTGPAYQASVLYSPNSVKTGAWITGRI